MTEYNRIKHGLEEIIRRTFEVIDSVYSVNKDKKNYCSRLIFPKYRNKENIRVSEQELRFIFVDQFIKYCSDPKNNFDYYYSVEIPTQYVYSFPHCNDKCPTISKDEEPGLQSASIDLAVYTRTLDTPVAIIEFKKDGCSAHGIAKDFLKLSVEPGIDKMLRYFLMISSSDTPLLIKNTNNENTSGLLKSFANKLEKDCFKFGTSNGLPWHEIDILWHRLPSNKKCQQNENIPSIDSKDFRTIYNNLLTKKVKLYQIDNNNFRAIYNNNGIDGNIEDLIKIIE